jgi:hypothetical protein
MCNSYHAQLSLGFTENTRSLDTGFVDMLSFPDGFSAVSFPNLMFTKSTNTNLITTDTEEYSLAQQMYFNLIKTGYMFQPYSHHQAYLQSLVELCMLNAYAMWDPSSEARYWDPTKRTHLTYIARQVIVDRPNNGCIAEARRLFLLT